MTFPDQSAGYRKTRLGRTDIGRTLINWIPTICFFLMLLLGLWIYQDYGISTDEEQSRLLGQVSLNYLAHLFQIPFLLEGVTPLANPVEVFALFRDRDYGVAFALPAELAIKILGIEGGPAYYFRHALTFLTFMGGVAAVYGLAKERYASRKWGLIAAAVLIVSPRIFGDAFFNDKDLVFMSVFVIGIYTLIQFLNHPSVRSALFHALACAVAIDVRIMAIVLPVGTIAILIIQVLKKEIVLSRALVLLSLFVCALIVLVIAMWPWLWFDPAANFFQALGNMSKFRWNGFMFFMGDIINAGVYIPWYYIPVWLGVTTPPLYVVLFIVGSVIVLSKLIGRRLSLWGNPQEMQDVITLGLAVAPVLAIIALHSVIYNGWRHVYFIYPCFVLIAIRGLYGLWMWPASSQHHAIIHKALMVIVVLSLGWTSLWMVRFHPYQYLYFNTLAGNWTQNFDVDYWGVAYRHSLEAIVKKNPSGPLVIFNNMRGPAWGYWQIPYWQNIPFLRPEDAARIDGKRTEACSDFVITSLAGNAKQYSQKSEFELIDEIKVDGKLIYATYQRKVPIASFYPQLGKPILFSQNASQCFLPSGWVSRAEDWGVWSLGQQAQISLPLPMTTNGSQLEKPKYLDLDLHAFVNAAHPSQELQIQVNQGQTKSYRLSKFEGNAIRIPLSLQDQEKAAVQLHLTMPGALSPKALGMGEDERVLGVGLVRAQFN